MLCIYSLTCFLASVKHVLLSNVYELPQHKSDERGEDRRYIIVIFLVSVPVRTEPVSNGSRFDSVRCSVRISFEPFEHLITNSLPCIPAPRVHNDDWFVVLVYFMYKYM